MTVRLIRPALVPVFKKAPPPGVWRAMYYGGYAQPVLVYEDGRVWSVRYSRWCKQKVCGIYPTLSNTLVHHLVLCAFRGAPKLNQEARHLDGKPNNNRLINLVWGTAKQNYLDRVRHGTDNARPKKLTASAKAKIITAVDISATGRRQLAERFGLSTSYIYALLRNAKRDTTHARWSLGEMPGRVSLQTHKILNVE